MSIRAARIAEQKALADEASTRALEMATNSLATQLGGLMKQATASTAAPVKGAR